MAELLEEDAVLTTTRCGKQMEIFTEMLDYEYVAKCSCLDTLKSILKALKCGDYGRYPHLEKTVADKIISMLPEKEKNRIQAMRSIVPDDVVKNEKGSLVDWMEGFSCEHEPVKNHGNEFKKFNANERNPVRGVVNALHGDSSRVVPCPLQKESIEPTKVNKPSGLIRKEKLSTKEYFEAWAKFDCDDSSDDEESGNNDANDSEPNSNKNQREEASHWNDEISRLQQHLQNNEFSTLERRTMSENERVKGNDCYRAGEMEESIICYTKSIMLNPVNAKVYANRAQARIRMNELDLALQDCNEAITLNPAYTKALARRGMILQKKGRYEEAISDFSECCRLETASVYERFLERCKEKHEEEISRKKTTTTLKILEVDGTEEDEVNVDGDELDVIEEVYTPGALESQSGREYDRDNEKVFAFEKRFTSNEVTEKEIGSSGSTNFQIDASNVTEKSFTTSPMMKMNKVEASEKRDGLEEPLMMRINIVMEDDDDDKSETTSPINEDENNHLNCSEKLGKPGTLNDEFPVNIVNEEETRGRKIKSKRKNHDATALCF